MVVISTLLRLFIFDKSIVKEKFSKMMGMKQNYDKPEPEKGKF